MRVGATGLTMLQLIASLGTTIIARSYLALVQSYCSSGYGGYGGYDGVGVGGLQCDWGYGYGGHVPVGACSL